MADQADKPDTKQPDHQPDNIEVYKYGDKNLDAPAYANVLKEAKAKQRASWWVRFNILLTTGAVWLQCVRCNKILSAKNPSQVCSQQVRACDKKLMEAAAGGSRMPPSPSPQPGPSTTPSTAPPAAPSNDPSAGLSAGPSAPPGPFAGFEFSVLVSVSVWRPPFGPEGRCVPLSTWDSRSIEVPDADCWV
ncbi:hypothetical protein VOLCADRAFT_90981 [Volvox carteri f. nagariensis]|uniref:Uncharacterized protein n=1 Tax=Volvox carteri f. nagariensis TaxID=3068 RepID=D8TVW1_VOLCA|nr:uncharacterized protein VOLCADRAFT_90981 [Volvox carteri f. nagariensis]EFJ48264.1 hypothetical protein VOLCADRAFT_90981 [Volvox carteri f. nagariensis]|eukprot:XP_002950518.1 hypothetical protein VOLCADRAFT_90981 [Volvox carteri f. nagariensis]